MLYLLLNMSLPKLSSEFKMEMNMPLTNVLAFVGATIFSFVKFFPFANFCVFGLFILAIFFTKIGREIVDVTIGIYICAFQQKSIRTI